MSVALYTNFSNGYIVEYVAAGQTACTSWLLLPAENLWHVGVRATLYILAMLYLFLGIAIVSDVFMCSIEVITSKKRTIVKWDEEKQEKVEVKVLVWNETVANLTLMALGSSAPEIILAVITQCSSLGQPQANINDLGTFTIIGSAAFNLLMITAVCVVSVPHPEQKKIKEQGVFVITTIWSLWAYVWMLIVVQFITPNEVDIWEAFITLGFFPIMVVMAYCQDNGWWCHKCKKNSVNAEDSEMQVRVVNMGSQMLHGPSRELNALGKERDMKHRNSVAPVDATDDNQNEKITAISEGDRPREEGGSYMGSNRSLSRDPESHAFARARFRHAAVRQMMGGKKHRPISSKKHMSEVVDTVRTIHNLSPDISGDDLCGKFTFASPSYSVLESAGILEVDILFHRSKVSKSTLQVPNGRAKSSGKSRNIDESAVTKVNAKVEPGQGHDEITGVVTIDYETREGSAKFDKDFKKTTGTLIFMENEYRKAIAIPIINDLQYEADTEFYIILKNPGGDGGIGEPSIARVTIIDDDEPGEFQFEQPSITANLKTGKLAVNVIRQKGCDGTVSVEYATIDGTAKGGVTVDPADYKHNSGKLSFKHGETTKTITIEVNKDAEGSKNFIITLRNPSIGCKIGEHSAALAFVSSDHVGEKLARIIDDDDEEDMTWGGQIIAAMSVQEEEDEEGNKVPLKWYDYVIHFLMFFWKVFFALIPPKNYGGGFPAFFLSLLGIGLCTAFVEQIANLLGCAIDLRPAVTGITLVALGTSLPDTFASRTAALHDEYADAAIGNVTGSNSVNVFLGLGLPWCIASIYYSFDPEPKRVNSANLFQGVIFFLGAAVICVIILFLRRYISGGELGGKVKSTKIITGIIMATLWLIYIILSSLVAYDVIVWNPFTTTTT
ncbi:sodium/calcium exchanger 1-like isoform X2 [Lineus longissimus]|uniref:sodium/calcium exchanger 1-like isoform X2 n=1 Tax=Lineus longissimus TaxID=88925 RepID=UPI00315D37CE